MSLGVYFHIPYCLQKCTYCDFATYEINTVLSPEKYVEFVKQEMALRSAAIPTKQIDTIYFGGGTPSLLKPKFIVSLINELANLGFHLKKEIEVTMEINPSADFDKNLEAFLLGGVNRFSVGAQSFDDQHLKSCGRKHTSHETTQTLGLLQKHGLNFSMDILFALPHQSFEQVSRDIEIALSFEPKHVSTYCLTVPKGHQMSYQRPKESVQVSMFSFIKKKLAEKNIFQYEISNFAKKGFQSKHNMIYWQDKAYWGLGLSAHSYFPDQNLRFWNPKSMGEYTKCISEKPNKLANLSSISTHLNKANFEFLRPHEQMTDFCHISLRVLRGLSEEALRNKFLCSQVALILDRLRSLEQDHLVQYNSNHWSLSDKGRLVSNIVFEKLHFSKDDIPQNSLYT